MITLFSHMKKLSPEGSVIKMFNDISMGYGWIKDIRKDVRIILCTVCTLCLCRMVVICSSNRTKKCVTTKAPYKVSLLVPIVYRICHILGSGSRSGVLKENSNTVFIGSDSNTDLV